MIKSKFGFFFNQYQLLFLNQYQLLFKLIFYVQFLLVIYCLLCGLISCLQILPYLKEFLFSFKIPVVYMQGGDIIPSSASLINSNVDNANACLKQNFNATTHVFQESLTAPAPILNNSTFYTIESVWGDPSSTIRKPAQLNPFHMQIPNLEASDVLSNINSSNSIPRPSAEELKNFYGVNNSEEIKWLYKCYESNTLVSDLIELYNIPEQEQSEWIFNFLMKNPDLISEEIINAFKSDEPEMPNSKQFSLQLKRIKAWVGKMSRP